LKKITKIIIWDKNVSCVNQSNKQYCNGYDILLSRYNRRLLSYFDCSNLRNINNIELYRRDFSWKLNKILISNIQLNRLAKYIANEHQLEKTDLWSWKFFDCASFAYFMKWIKYINNVFEPSEFKKLNFNKEKLEIWDMVYTWKRESFIRKLFSRTICESHFMIYLWEWLYISKFWASGRLIITDLEEYKKIYPYDFIYILRERHGV
jgi:hypothetical protein